MTTEIEEVEALIAQATFPGVKDHLQKYLSKIQPPPPKVIEEPIVPESKLVDPVEHKANDFVEHKPPRLATITSGAFIPLEDYAWEQGSYNSPTINIYIELENVGSVKDQVHCNFGQYSFDLTISNLNGKNYRLVKDSLEKDIIPNECKVTVKKNKIVLKLAKVKGEYSYEQWSQLTSKKPRDPIEERKKKEDPSASIMDMMKDMYDSGDENMKKVIGEAMMKSQRGEKPSAGPDF